jgi:hypothetical protein
LRKALLYTVAAIVLGVLLTLIPLITLTGSEAGTFQMSRDALANSMDKLENIYDIKTGGLPLDSRIFIFSFVVAAVFYVFFKFRVKR